MLINYYLPLEEVVGSLGGLVNRILDRTLCGIAASSAPCRVSFLWPAKKRRRSNCDTKKETKLK